MQHLLPVVALAALLLSPTANAQRELSFAPYGGYNFDTENAVVGIGLNADFGRIGPCRVGMWGDIETQFEENVTILQFDLNVTPYYDIGKIELAAGIGIALERQSFDNSSGSNTETGFNTLIGVKYNSGFINPFARFRCTFFNGFDSDFRIDTLFGGVMIPILTY